MILINNSSTTNLGKVHPLFVSLFYSKTEYKRLVVCLQLPDNYPHEALVIEIKSKTLPENFLQGFTKLCDQEVKKVIGKAQVGCNTCLYINLVAEMVRNVNSVVTSPGGSKFQKQPCQAT